MRLRSATNLFLSSCFATGDAFSVEKPKLSGFAESGTHQRPSLTTVSSRLYGSAASTPESSAAAVATNLNALSLFSPCKINLFLRIIRKRPDGYHDLASLFQAVAFGDTLELSVIDDPDATQDIFTCNMRGVPVDSSNLVIRALELMRERTGQRIFFQANLIKQVPAQAGLGGGSSNAATALWGANALMGRPASLENLIDWSSALGSDITFFLSRGTAYCTGRGEIMTPIDPPLASGTPIYLVKPTSIGLSTPSVFKALDYGELSPLDPDTMLLPAFVDPPPSDWAAVDAACFVNDLEPPAFRVVPELRQIKEALQRHGFNHVLMSGSGTTIFCLGRPRDADQFEKEFVMENRHDVDVFVSNFISRRDGEWYEKVDGTK